MYDHYLNLLGIEPNPPGIDALNEIVAAHLERVPFENISKLYHRRKHNFSGLLDFEHYLVGIEQYHFGGTCYANNYYLYLLLRHLGYEIILCGAGMNHPDVHMVSIVTLEDCEYIVDVGYAAPFMRPMPRNLSSEYIIEWGRDRYVLKPMDDQRRSRMDLHRDGELIHGYVVKPIHREIDHFESVIADSFRDEATFMNALLLARFFENRSLVINNYTMIESEGTSCTTSTFANRRELAQGIEEHFDIPESIAAGAIAELGEFGNAWS